MQLKVVVGSKNSVKMSAVEQGFLQIFPVQEFVFEGVASQSRVAEQPTSDNETFQGAWNRAQNAREISPDADYWAGIESGIDFIRGEMVAFSWVVIQSRADKWGKGRTSTFFLPPSIVSLVKQGKDLGQADNIVFGRTNSQQENGAIGLLSGNIITRTSYLIDAVVIALIPFKNPALYFDA